MRCRHSVTRPARIQRRLRDRRISPFCPRSFQSCVWSATGFGRWLPFRAARSLEPSSFDSRPSLNPRGSQDGEGQRHHNAVEHGVMLPVAASRGQNDRAILALMGSTRAFPVSTAPGSAALKLNARLRRLHRSLPGKSVSSCCDEARRATAARSSDLDGVHASTRNYGMAATGAGFEAGRGDVSTVSCGSLRLEAAGALPSSTA